MTTSHLERKRKALTERLSLLERQWKAANDQRDATLNNADRIPLDQQIKRLDEEIEEVERELAEMDADRNSSQSSGGEKGSGATSGSKPLFGAGLRWAMLVGVNHYDDSLNYGGLKLAVHDADSLHDRLVASGYDQNRIFRLTDETGDLPTRNNILATLQSVADATGKDDLLLFYYSGHGEAVAGQSYLVARDGRRLTPGDTAVPLARVEEIIRKAPARGKVIIIDSCHSGADFSGKGPQPMSEEFIRHVFEQAEGMAVLTSCQQGELSYETVEKNQGVFTFYLLEALAGAADTDQKGFVTVQDLNHHVVNSVRLWATRKLVRQTPTLRYSVSGDIIVADFRQAAPSA
jgi:hypothetical protein